MGLILQYISQGADVNWKNEKSDNMTSLHNATFGVSYVIVTID